MAKSARNIGKVSMKLSVLMPHFNRQELLKCTLESYEHFYKDKPFEVIIVDDASTHSLDDLIKQFSIDIKLFKIPRENKTGTNPSLLFNIAAKQASGDVFLLTSPEIMHTKDIFEQTNNFEKLTNETYLICSCLTNTNPRKVMSIKDMKERFRVATTEDNGMWYQHTKLRTDNNLNLHFCNVLTKALYFEMRGFDERYRPGIGYDDNEFLRRITEFYEAKLIHYDDFVSIHLAHPMVDQYAPDFMVRTNRNYSLFENDKKLNFYYVNPEDKWGIL